MEFIPRYLLMVVFSLILTVTHGSVLEKSELQGICKTMNAMMADGASPMDAAEQIKDIWIRGESPLFRRAKKKPVVKGKKPPAGADATTGPIDESTINTLPGGGIADSANPDITSKKPGRGKVGQNKPNNANRPANTLSNNKPTPNNGRPFDDNIPVSMGGPNRPGTSQEGPTQPNQPTTLPASVDTSQPIRPGSNPNKPSITHFDSGDSNRPAATHFGANQPNWVTNPAQIDTNKPNRPVITQFDTNKPNWPATSGQNWNTASQLALSTANWPSVDTNMPIRPGQVVQTPGVNDPNWPTVSQVTPSKPIPSTVPQLGANWPTLGQLDTTKPSHPGGTQIGSLSQDWITGSQTGIVDPNRPVVSLPGLTQTGQDWTSGPQFETVGTNWPTTSQVSSSQPSQTVSSSSNSDDWMSGASFDLDDLDWSMESEDSSDQQTEATFGQDWHPALQLGSSNSIQPIVSQANSDHTATTPTLTSNQGDSAILSSAKSGSEKSEIKGKSNYNYMYPIDPYPYNPYPYDPYVYAEYEDYYKYYSKPVVPYNVMSHYEPLYSINFGKYEDVTKAAPDYTDPFNEYFPNQGTSIPMQDQTFQPYIKSPSSLERNLKKYLHDKNHPNDTDSDSEADANAGTGMNPFHRRFQSTNTPTDVYFGFDDLFTGYGTNVDVVYACMSTPNVVPVVDAVDVFGLTCYPLLKNDYKGYTSLLKSADGGRNEEFAVFQSYDPTLLEQFFRSNGVSDETLTKAILETYVDALYARAMRIYCEGSKECYKFEIDGTNVNITPKPDGKLIEIDCESFDLPEKVDTKGSEYNLQALTSFMSRISI